VLPLCPDRSAPGLLRGIVAWRGTAFAPDSVIMNASFFPCRVVAAALLYLTVLLRPALCQTAAEPATAAERNLARVLVAHDSLSGNTEKMAQGVVAGAKRVLGARPRLGASLTVMF
jgi:hypothetical protein